MQKFGTEISIRQEHSCHHYRRWCPYGKLSSIDNIYQNRFMILREK